MHQCLKRRDTVGTPTRQARREREVPRATEAKDDPRQHETGRWTQHSLQNLADREIDHAVADAVLARAESESPDPPGRCILMGRYDDLVLQQEMLLRIVVEDAADEIVVVTVYKTSQVQRYLKGLLP